jgi:gluconolactonase
MVIRSACLLPFLFALVGVSIVCHVAGAAEHGPDRPPTVGSVERLDPRIDAIVPKDAAIEVLAGGFDWSEGPVWIAKGGYLLFSDVPANTVFQWMEGKGVRPFLRPSGFTGVVEYGREPGSNGLAVDGRGRLLSCEHGDRRVSVLTIGGGKRTLADNWRGKRFNSPNDLALHASGAIYFTDPPYGLPKGADDPDREIDCFGVYRIGVDGSVDLLCDTMTRPNGIAFSPDQETLYVAQSDPAAPVIRSFGVKPDGTLDEGRVFFDAAKLLETRKGLPDGLKVDSRGTLFATGPGGVLVIDPDGTHLGSLLTGQATANCGFGADERTLFITADSWLCRVRLADR